MPKNLHRDADEARSFMRAWGIVFGAISLVALTFAGVAANDLPCWIEPFSAIGMKAWGPMAAVSVAAAAGSILMFGVGKVAGLLGAQREEAASSTPEVAAQHE